MEFINQHPLAVMHVLTALVAFAAGFTTYHFGWRRGSQSNHDGMGGNTVGWSRREKRAPTHRGPRRTQFPLFYAQESANEDRLPAALRRGQLVVFAA